MRHGEVAYFVSTATYNPNGVELTDRGRAQAAAAGRALRGVAFDRVITSGYSRAVETARTVLQSAGTTRLPEIERWPEFQEFRDTRISGLTVENVEAQFLGAFDADPTLDARYLGGESVGEMLSRVNAALDRLLAVDDWVTALVVLHGGVNRAIVSRALAGRPAFFGHVEQSPGCLNVLDHGPDWYVRAVNVVPHNPAHAGPRTTTIEELLADYRALRGWAN